jgi:hypothetical protein
MPECKFGMNDKLVMESEVISIAFLSTVKHSRSLKILEAALNENPCFVMCLNEMEWNVL